MTDVTHGRMWRIAGPIVMSNATVPLLGAVILATLCWVFGFQRRPQR